MDATSNPIANTKAADQKFCHSCGYILHNSAASCPKCGAAQPASNSNASSFLVEQKPNNLSHRQLPQHHIYCRGCGEPIHETAENCPKCGARQSLNSTSSGGDGKSRIVAAVLALVLGGLGVHKFYLGRIWWGLLYLVFCWTFIPGIIAFIEGIYYLTLSDSEFRKKYD